MRSSGPQRQDRLLIDRVGGLEVGFTLIELMVALSLSFVVVLALGKIVLQNQRSMTWGRDKVVLQQNATEAAEWMARSVRASRRLEVLSSSRFRTYDEGDTITHVFELLTVGGFPRLRENGGDLVDRNCTLFQVTPDDDTTSLVLEIELEDDSGNRVRADTRAAVRNRTFEY